MLLNADRRGYFPLECMAALLGSCTLDVSTLRLGLYLKHTRVVMGTNGTPYKHILP